MLSWIEIVLIVVGVPALLLWVLRRVSPELAQGEWPERWPFPWKGWHLGVAVVAALVLASLTVGRHDSGVFLVPAALVALTLFLGAWKHEVLFLMARRDDEFPGGYDKLIWAALLVAAAPLGVWVFRSYRLAHWPESELEPGRAKPRSAPDLL